MNGNTKRRICKFEFNCIDILTFKWKFTEFGIKNRLLSNIHWLHFYLFIIHTFINTKYQYINHIWNSGFLARKISAFLICIYAIQRKRMHIYVNKRVKERYDRKWIRKEERIKKKMCLFFLLSFLLRSFAFEILDCFHFMFFGSIFYFLINLKKENQKEHQTKWVACCFRVEAKVDEAATLIAT